MSPLGAVSLFAALFVGTHLLMSHPLRAGLVARLGAKGFLGLYSLVSLATFIPLVLARKSAGAEAWLWQPPGWTWIVVAAVMWLASVLLIGSFIRNPAMNSLQKPDAPIGAPAGIFRVTRHPMMWSFALWGLTHIAVQPEPSAIVLALAIIILALAGSAGQDIKKRALLGERWTALEAQTSFVPFARGFAWPGAVPVLGGTALFLAATWAHPIPVGFWALL